MDWLAENWMLCALAVVLWLFARKLEAIHADVRSSDEGEVADHDAADPSESARSNLRRVG